MRSGVCPKCNSTEIYKKINGISHGSGNGKIYIRTSSATHPTDVENFICAACGFFESYAMDENKLFEVTRNWEKAA